MHFMHNAMENLKFKSFPVEPEEVEPKIIETNKNEENVLELEKYNIFDF